MADRWLPLAVEKLFINLGEAATRIPPEHRQSMPGVPWRAIVGLRNVMAHGYESVDHATLYATARDDLPGLEQELVRLLAP